MLNEADDIIDDIKRKVSKRYDTLPSSFRKSKSSFGFSKNSQNVQYLNHFKASPTYFSMLTNFIELEKQIYREINLLVNSLDKDKPLGKQGKTLKDINRYLSFLKHYNCHMAEHAESFLNQEHSQNYQNIKNIAGSIILTRQDWDEDYILNDPDKTLRNKSLQIEDE